MHFWGWYRSANAFRLLDLVDRPDFTSNRISLLRRAQFRLLPQEVQYQKNTT